MRANLTMPFSLALDFDSGKLDPATSVVRRHLSDMCGMYADVEAERRLQAVGNPLINEALQHVPV